MPTLQFRLAEDEDVAAVVRLVNAAYRGDSSRKGWTTEADLLGGQRSDSRGIRELLATPGSVIVLGKQCLAYAERFVRQHWAGSTIRMTVISVRDELIAYYRRKGYQLTGEMEPFPMGDERFGIPKVDMLEFVVLEKSLPSRTESSK